MLSQIHTINLAFSNGAYFGFSTQIRGNNSDVSRFGVTFTTYVHNSTCQSTTMMCELGISYLGNQNQNGDFPAPFTTELFNHRRGGFLYQQALDMWANASKLEPYKYNKSYVIGSFSRPFRAKQTLAGITGFAFVQPFSACSQCTLPISASSWFCAACVDAATAAQHTTIWPNMTGAIEGMIISLTYVDSVHQSTRRNTMRIAAGRLDIYQLSQTLRFQFPDPTQRMVFIVDRHTKYLMGLSDIYSPYAPPDNFDFCVSMKSESPTVAASAGYLDTHGWPTDLRLVNGNYVRATMFDSSAIIGISGLSWYIVVVMPAPLIDGMPLILLVMLFSCTFLPSCSA